MRNIFTCCLLIGTALVGCSSAANIAPVIRDVVYGPDGRAFSGIITIDPKGFPGSQRPATLIVPVEDGMLSVRVAASITAGPAAFYVVTYADRMHRTRWTETWRVPENEKGDLSLKDVVVSRAGYVDAKGRLGRTIGAEGGRDLSLPIPTSAIYGLNSTLSSINASLTTLAWSITELTNRISDENSMLTIYGETPAGAINGTNGSFLLANVAQPNTVAVYRNGQRLTLGTDVTVSGNSLQFIGAVPMPGDVITVDYQIINGGKDIRREKRDIALPIQISDVSGLSAELNQINNSVQNITGEVAGADADLQTLSVTTVTGEIPQGSIDGQNATFTLINQAANNVRIYKNGIRQSVGIDYSIAGNKVTFLPASLPQPGDILTADYTF